MQKFRIAIEFDAAGPESLGRVLEAKVLLEEDLQTGVVDGYHCSRDSIWLFVVACDPRRCIADVVRQVGWIGMAPRSASVRRIDFDPAGLARIGEEVERMPLDGPAASALPVSLAPFT